MRHLFPNQMISSKMTVEQKAALLDEIMDQFNTAGNNYIQHAHLTPNHISLTRAFDNSCKMTLIRACDRYTGVAHMHVCEDQ
jgi:hypothetical protein